jgi:hypothetical protein
MQDGDPDSISKLANSCHPRLILYPMKILSQHESTRDAVQDSWNTIFEWPQKDRGSS